MKTVIITGTSSGIGLDLVKTFDLNGYYVISLSRNNLPITTSYSENVNHINFDITNNVSLTFSAIFLAVDNSGLMIVTWPIFRNGRVSFFP